MTSSRKAGLLRIGLLSFVIVVAAAIAGFALHW